MTHMGQFDLNLLVALDVLLDERNVTRAAARMHLSQPALSAQLGRLRDVFGDPLLLPGPRGMRPTARGDALQVPLHEALESVRRAIAPEGPFDPGASTRTWRIAGTDYGETTILLPALPTLRTQSPQSRIAVIELVPARLVSQAERGEIDLAFHTTEGAPGELHRRRLFTERYVLAGRAGHPRLRRRPTLAQFAMLDQAIVSPDGGGFRGSTDEALAALGATRRVVLSVPHFLFLRSVLEHSDLVAMLPERLARELPGLRVVDAPVEVPGYEMSMLWHERVHRDPAHRWLRETIANAV